MRRVRVALAGCGTVGGHLVALLRAYQDAIATAHGVHLDIVRVLVRDAGRPRIIPLPPHVVTDDIASFNDTPADIVVEAMGGVQDALCVAAAAVRAGRRLVTANKALIAAYGPRLATAARAADSAIGFEAAVAGGVPVVRVLRDALLRDDVRAICGILNGTTNFILTAMEAGAPFRVALAEAQDRGFAEADPTRDLDGGDAADKIRILAWLASGVPPASIHVPTRGVLPDPDALVAAARDAGGAIRLLAEYVRLEDGVTAVVEPVLVARDSAFARTAAQDNHVRIETGWTGALSLEGPGAGGGPTASSLLADVLENLPRPAARGIAGAGAPDALGGAAVQDHRRGVPRGVADPRLHQWLLRVHEPVARTHELLEATGVWLTVQQRQGPVLDVLTGPCSRADLGRVAAALSAAGIRAVYMRVDAAAAGKLHLAVRPTAAASVHIPLA